MNTDRKVRFTVIVPLYNKREFARATLATVLAQDYSEFEVVVVDDGSTDGSCDVVIDMADPRIRLVRQANAGPGAARNRGFAAMHGEWGALIDADDLWAPDHLSSLAQIIENRPQSDVVATSFRRGRAAAADGEEWPARAGVVRDLNYFREVRDGIIHTSSVAIRRSAFAQTTGFGSYCPGEDEEFWARLALDHPFAVSTSVTSTYVRGNDGIMDRDERLDQRDQSHVQQSPTVATLERALRDRRYAHLRDDIGAYLDRLWLRDARICLYRAKPRAARACLRFTRHARGTRFYFYWLLSWVPAALLRPAMRLFSRVKRRGASANANVR